MNHSAPKYYAINETGKVVTTFLFLSTALFFQYNNPTYTISDTQP